MHAKLKIAKSNRSRAFQSRDGVTFVSLLCCMEAVEVGYIEINDICLNDT